MTFQAVPEAIPIGIATVISGTLALVAWRHRKMPMAPAFAVMTSGQTLWALGAAIEPVVAEMPIKRLCIDVRVAGTLVALLGLLAFVFRYAGLFRWLKASRFSAICVPALHLLVLVWTDPWHHLYWAKLSNERVGDVMIAIRSYGPGFWALIVYCYLLAAASALLLGQKFIGSRGVHRIQAGVMLFGVLLPWLLDIMDMLGLFGFIPVDLVSMSFAVTGLTFLPALFRFHLIDLPPVAWAVVVKGIDDPVVVIDPWRRIVEANPAAERLLCRTSREIMGVEAAAAFSKWPALAERLGQVGADVESLEVEKPNSNSASSFDARISPLGEHVRPSGWVLVLRDISGLRRAEEERVRMLREQAARTEAEAANKAKDRFLATISHELRTPLTPILATVTALLDDRATPAAFQTVLEMIRRNVALEARLIDDLLDLTRINRGELLLRREIIDAHEQTHLVLEICGDDAENAGITLISQLAAEHHQIDADPTRFQQVLWNLVKNAIKFSAPGGKVAIRSRDRPDSTLPAPGCWLVIEVIDQGIGIDPDLMPRIFSMFEQGAPSTGRKMGGLGLGLTISRSIVEQHGGRLAAASEGQGKGAILTLELPCVLAPDRIAPVPSPAPSLVTRHRRLKILLVEDNRDTLNYLSAMLTQRGHVVHTSTDLATALRMGSQTSFELLISDIDLPDGSGLELMWRLRLQSDLKGIALSGFGTPDDIDQSRLAGYSEHLTKPVEFWRLEEAIERVAAGGRVDGQVKS
jgi:signal transduction histidine kinase/ActR/RegA family two-component response regulator